MTESELLEIEARAEKGRREHISPSLDGLLRFKVPRLVEEVRRRESENAELRKFISTIGSSDDNVDLSIGLERKLAEKEREADELRKTVLGLREALKDADEKLSFNGMGLASSREALQSSHALAERVLAEERAKVWEEAAEFIEQTTTCSTMDGIGLTTRPRYDVQGKLLGRKMRERAQSERGGKE